MREFVADGISGIAPTRTLDARRWTTRRERDHRGVPRSRQARTRVRSPLLDLPLISSSWESPAYYLGHYNDQQYQAEKKKAQEKQAGNPSKCGAASVDRDR